MVPILSLLLAIQTVKTPSAPPDLPALIKRIQPSVVTVLTYDAAGKPLRQGSGFFIGTDGRFVTNVHVLEDAYRAEIKIHDGRAYEVTSILADDLAADWIVAGLTDLTLSRFQPLTLSRTAPEGGQSIIVLGSPLGLEQTLSAGIVSAVRKGGDAFQFTAPVSPGSSGGPVLNLQGEVLGIVRSQLTGGQNLNFAVPSDKLVGLRLEVRTLAVWRDAVDEKRGKRHSRQVDLFYNKATGELYPLLPADAYTHTCVWTIWGDHGSQMNLATETTFISRETSPRIGLNRFLPPRVPIYVTCVDWSNNVYQGKLGDY